MTIEKIFRNFASMKKSEITKETLNKTVTKMVSDKNLVRDYMKGKVSLEELNKRGIKFAKPL